MILPYKECPNKCGQFIFDNCPICGKSLEKISVKSQKKLSSQTSNLLKFQNNIYDLLYPFVYKFADCSIC